MVISQKASSEYRQFRDFLIAKGDLGVVTNFFREKVVGFVRNKPDEEQDQLRARIEEFQIGRFGWLLNIPTALLFGHSLTMLATIYMSDKWNYHWYAQHYENLLGKQRRQNMNLLEIGIGGYDNPGKGGNSFLMWKDYLPHSHIYGVDIYDKSPHDQRRIKTFRGSQADAAFLDKIVNEIGKLDVIIDDGSHMNEHMLFTFHHLFPCLADGGLYVIEDVQTSYWKEYGGNETNHNDVNTVIGFCKTLIDGLNWEEFRGSHDPSYFDQNIKSIAFYHNMIAIRKGSNREGSRSQR